MPEYDLVPRPQDRDYTKFPDKILTEVHYNTPLRRTIRNATSNFTEPTGTNVEKKIKGITVIAAMGGGFVGMMEAFVKVAPSVFAVGGYFSRAVVTLGASGFLFGVGTQGTAVLRDKDDIFNYAVGGALAGLPMAKRYGNVWAGLGYALAFTSLGIFSRTLLVRPKENLPLCIKNQVEICMREVMDIIFTIIRDLVGIRLH